MRLLQVYDSGNAQADLLANGLSAAGHWIDVLRGVERPLGEYGIPDVLHVHGARVAASRLSEWWSYTTHRGIVPLIQYATSDIRSRADAVRSNIYAHLDDAYDEQAAGWIATLSSVFPACIVESAEAAEYAAKFHRRVYVIPAAIRFSDFRNDTAEQPDSSSKGPIVVLYAPEPSAGGEFVEKAVARLRAEGYDVRAERGDAADRDEARNRMKKADIVVDQLLHGSYGLAAVEAMASGKPVLSHIREDLAPRTHPELPIVSANPATVYRQLLPLLKDQGLRQALGSRGRAYAERHHSLDAVISKLAYVYRMETEQKPEPHRPTIDAGHAAGMHAVEAAAAPLAPAAIGAPAPDAQRLGQDRPLGRNAGSARRTRASKRRRARGRVGRRSHRLRSRGRRPGKRTNQRVRRPTKRRTGRSSGRTRRISRSLPKRSVRKVTAVKRR